MLEGAGFPESRELLAPIRAAHRGQLGRARPCSPHRADRDAATKRPWRGIRRRSRRLIPSCSTSIGPWQSGPSRWPGAAARRSSDDGGAETGRPEARAGQPALRAAATGLGADDGLSCTRGTSRCCATAREECEVVVMSLFVDPRPSSGAGEDLERYPRDEARDARLGRRGRGCRPTSTRPAGRGGLSTGASRPQVAVERPDRGALTATRRSRGPGALPRRHHRRREALQHGSARGRLLRPRMPSSWR